MSTPMIHTSVLIDEVVEGDVLAAHADHPVVRAVQLTESYAVVFVEDQERPIVRPRGVRTFVQRWTDREPSTPKAHELLEGYEFRLVGLIKDNKAMHVGTVKQVIDRGNRIVILWMEGGRAYLRRDDRVRVY